MKKVAILTSGGDAPGMNAAIRAITLQALHFNWQVIGFNAGYNGLLNKDYQLLDSYSVNDIIRYGGTILKSARCSAMKTPEGPILAAKVLAELNIDCLFVVGGDGSFRGACAIAPHYKGNIIGLPGTIDNDVNGTDQTIGFATAIDTAIDAIDKIRDTANAFERIFVVEVMGRDCGFIAIESAIACGAEQVICKEIIDNETSFINRLLSAIKQSVSENSRQSYVIVLAEHALSMSAHALSELIATRCNIDCRAAILGYIQRGGSPVAEDRILATQLGIAAVNLALENQKMVMVGKRNGKLVTVPLAETNLKNEQNKQLIQRLNQFNFNLSGRINQH
jgi:6-phosphofructokinase 1